ncbi:TPA: hypothetical protein ACKRKO_001168 [Pseudomonas aeruginosa]
MRKKKIKKTPISFGHGCAVNDELFCVSSFPDEINPETEYTRIFILNLSSAVPWMHHDIAGRTIVSMALRPASHNTPRACYALSSYGELQIFNSTEVVEEEIPATGSRANRRDGLTFSAISRIGTKEYVCGALGRIYRRDGDGWVQVATDVSNMAFQELQSVIGSVELPDSGNISEMTAKLRGIPNFEHISGTAENDIYACGNNGIIFHWNGKHWNALRSPTRQHLHYINCNSPDEIYICGHNGTLLSGNARNGFHRVALGKNDLNLWTVRKFNEAIYVGTTSGLFRAEKQKLQPVDLGLSESLAAFTVQALDATERVLWVVADKFLLRLEGGAWEKIDHPDNTL